MAERSTVAKPGTRVIAGTIVARNYLPAAHVLAESYLRFHPHSSVQVLVLDATAEELAELASQTKHIKFISPDQLNIAALDYQRMATAYSVTELATAVKPSFLQTLLAHGDVALYLDPDIEVFAGIDEVGELALEHGIVLTPHFTEPMPRDGFSPSEASLMGSGVFNLGFVAVSATAAPFLAFWAERLRHDALSAPSEQMFTDQRWVDMVPVLFSHAVVTDPGFNVAYWNVHQRPIHREVDGSFTAAGKPLRFFHFSGFRPEKPWLLSTHTTNATDRPRVLLSAHPELANLCAEYATKLTNAGYAETLESVPYRFATLPDGTLLSPTMRRTFRDAWVAAERLGKPLPPSPFGTNELSKQGQPDKDANTAAFLSWGAEPENESQRLAGIGRWAMALWRRRLDLQAAFPDPLGVNAEGYRQWCATSGVAEGELPIAAVPSVPLRVSIPVSPELGANLLGHLSAEQGVGEMGRLVHGALTQAGIPVATVVEESAVENRLDYPVPVSDVVEPRFPLSVLCVNADMTPAITRLRPELVTDRYIIGVWSWELSLFPERMHAAFNDVDEVWTISEFCQQAIAAAASVPVRVFPVPVRDPYPDGELPIKNNTGPIQFLFIFDHNSVFERKNPLAVVRAFQSAFTAKDNVRLVIKTMNGEKHLADREQLRFAIAGDQRIELIENYLDFAQISELYASADCYVSLHRSEGFGLTATEAMVRGLPVIITNYSGSAEIITADTGWPIGYRLVAVGKNAYPYPPEGEWAEPDIAEAVAAMRAVVADPAAARAKGLAARAHVLSTRSQQAAAAWVDQQVERAYSQWQRTGGRHQSAPPINDLGYAREALRWRADVHAPSRLPFAPALRKAVLRAIDHYDYHQRAVLGAVVDSVESSLADLRGHAEAVDGRIETLDNNVTTLAAHTRDELRSLASSQQVLAEKFDKVTDTLNATLETALTSLAERNEQERAGFMATIAGLETRLTSVNTAREDLELKLDTLLSERDIRLDRLTNLTEAALAGNVEFGRTIHALDIGLRRHHDLLTPMSADQATAAVVTDVGILRLPADDNTVLPWMRHYACWEPEQSVLIDWLLKPGDTFVDIGAHVGYFTVRALRLVGAEGAVFAVEPWAPVRELLERNVAANVPSEIVKALTVLPVAAWDVDERLGLRTLEVGNSGDHRAGKGVGEPVDGMRLDGVSALRQRRVNLVKSDAQGEDHRALAGMLQLLQADRPHVLCEFWPEAIAEAGDDPVAVIEQFIDWGYGVLPVTDKVVADVTAGKAITSRPLSPSVIVRAAEQESTGFLTLWLRPPSNTH